MLILVEEFIYLDSLEDLIYGLTTDLDDYSLHSNTAFLTDLKGKIDYAYYATIAKDITAGDYSNLKSLYDHKLELFGNKEVGYLIAANMEFNRKAATSMYLALRWLPC